MSECPERERMLLQYHKNGGLSAVLNFGPPTLLHRALQGPELRIMPAQHQAQRTSLARRSPCQRHHSPVPAAELLLRNIDLSTQDS